MKGIVYWQANVLYRAVPYAENFRAFFVMHEGKPIRVPKYSATVVEINENTNRTTQECQKGTGLAPQCVSGLGEGKPDCNRDAPA